MARALSVNQTVARRVAEVIDDYGGRIYRDSVKFAPFKTGALERSIRCVKRIFRRDYWKSFVEVSVPYSSPAGKYAHYIHNLRYIKWWNRGPGTKAKGRNAKEKFLDRAVDKWLPRMQAKVEEAAQKGMEEYAAKLASSVADGLR